MTIIFVLLYRGIQYQMSILLPKVRLMLLLLLLLLLLSLLHHLICSLVGPVPNSVSDFIRMIWEYKLPTVVMLTKCTEGGHVSGRFQFLPYTKHCILEIVCLQMSIYLHNYDMSNWSC